MIPRSDDNDQVPNWKAQYVIIFYKMHYYHVTLTHFNLDTHLLYLYLKWILRSVNMICKWN